ncbi:hypothetical protein BDR07DRAFT_1604091 [Suillus spraguei]|nr:hypothetical protein BDR07DRAFT_1604091 [Suillus spraguei]
MSQFRSNVSTSLIMNHYYIQHTPSTEYLLAAAAPLDLSDVFFHTTFIIVCALVPAIQITSAFQLSLEWEVICCGVIALALLYAISRHNKLYYDKVLWKYRIAEWYWRESDHLGQERPSLYYDLILAQQFLLRIQSWNRFQHAFYAIQYLPRYSNALYQVLPNPYSLGASLSGVECPTYFNSCDLTAVLPTLARPISNTSQLLQLGGFKPC